MVAMVMCYFTIESNMYHDYFRFIFHCFNKDISQMTIDECYYNAQGFVVCPNKTSKEIIKEDFNTCDINNCNRIIDQYLNKRWDYSSSSFGECRGCTPVVSFPSRMPQQPQISQPQIRTLQLAQPAQPVQPAQPAQPVQPVQLLPDDFPMLGSLKPNKIKIDSRNYNDIPNPNWRPPFSPPACMVGSGYVPCPDGPYKYQCINCSVSDGGIRYCFCGVTPGGMSYQVEPSSRSESRVNICDSKGQNCSITSLSSMAGNVANKYLYYGTDKKLHWIDRNLLKTYYPDFR